MGGYLKTTHTVATGPADRVSLFRVGTRALPRYLMTKLKIVHEIGDRPANRKAARVSEATPFDRQDCNMKCVGCP